MSVINFISIFILYVCYLDIVFFCLKKNIKKEYILNI